MPPPANICGACWAQPGQIGEDDEPLRFGTLTDPNGHVWRVCSDCIKHLWENKHPLNEDGDMRQKLKEALTAMIEGLEP